MTNYFLSDYQDTGCGGECVKSTECPYPRCMLDDPSVARGKRKPMVVTPHERRVERDGQMAELHAQGVTVDELVERYGLAKRTVFEILRRQRRLTSA